MNVATPSGGFLTLLRKRNFLLLWLAQLISMTILNASNYALLVLIEEVTGSTTLVGLAIICFSLPALLFGAPAGVFVDRMNKRRVLYWSNYLRAIATFGFVLSLLIDRSQVIPIYLLTFLISCIGQFFTPAEGASIPLLVNEAELMPALSLFNITFTLSQAIGFIIFAPLVLSLLPTFSLGIITLDSIEILYLIIGLLYLFCALLIKLIPSPYFTQTKAIRRNAISTQALGIVGKVWLEMSQGWGFIRRKKPLFLAVIQLSFANVLLLVIGELATPFVTHLLKLPANTMAIVFAPAGIGLVIGSLVMPRITARLGKSRAILVGLGALAVLLTLLTFAPLLPQALKLTAVPLLMFCAGAALDFINIPAQTAVQEYTPDWIKGRVLALQIMLYNACSIPIILFIGAIADLFGLANVLYLLAACQIAFGIWGFLYERKHQRLEPATNETGDIQEATEPDAIAP